MHFLFYAVTQVRAARAVRLFVCLFIYFLLIFLPLFLMAVRDEWNIRAAGAAL